MRAIDSINALDVTQVKYPVGPAKDAYYILSYLTVIVETGEITAKYTVVKNFYSNTKKEELFKGTLKECVEFIKNNVPDENTAGE